MADDGQPAIAAEGLMCGGLREKIFQPDLAFKYVLEQITFQSED